MRAVSVPVSKHSVMGGLLYPGSIVDVVATFRLSNNDRATGEAISTTLLHGVQVLAIQQKSIMSGPDSEEQSAPPASVRELTVTLMVDSKQAQALQLAMEKGSVSLAMRNPLDKDPVDAEAMVLSQGRLARMGSMLTPAVLHEDKLEGNLADLGSTITHNPAVCDKNLANKQSASDPAQWHVEVIRGKNVTQRSFEFSSQGELIVQ